MIIDSSSEEKEMLLSSYIGIYHIYIYMYLCLKAEVMEPYDRSEFTETVPGLPPQTNILASGKQQIRKGRLPILCQKAGVFVLGEQYIVSMLALIFQLPRSSAHIY